MNKKRPLVSKTCFLHKFPGKGDWTYAEIPEVKPDPKTPFGWVVVNGSIDNYQLKHVKLMPMGNGKLFLPVKAAIRRKTQNRKETMSPSSFILRKHRSTFLKKSSFASKMNPK